MSFNSLQFLVFFSVIISLYFLFPMRKMRYVFLLAASYYFYMSWEPRYVILIFTSTVITYVTSLLMGKESSTVKRKKYLILSLVLNLAILLFFKYFNFINNSIAVAVAEFNYQWGIPNFNVLLPIGISFYTFQALSYSIDVYRGDKKPEKDFWVYALYVSFFPQLVAGPIERSWHLIPQFHKHYTFNYERIVSGVMLMAWGFFKKIVIADKLAILVDTVYGDVYSYTGLSLIIATVLFAFQIYCDFSGYSDIAIGAARVMGFDIMNNFNRPYHAKTIGEFWKRWHISLSTWFRDYVYIPLGGNRVTRARHYINLMITFVVSGLWHGAAWTFAFWGALHGLYMLVSISTRDIRKKVTQLTGFSRLNSTRKIFQILSVFVLVDFAWIFFRANTFNDALYVVTHLFSGLGGQLKNILTFKFNIGMKPYSFIVLLATLVFMELVHILQRKVDFESVIMSKPFYIRFALYYLFILSIIYLGEFGSKSFIYFQF